MAAAEMCFAGGLGAALDLALVQGDVAHEALAGIGRAPADLRVLAAMYSTPGMFVVRADSPASSRVVEADT